MGLMASHRQASVAQGEMAQEGQVHWEVKTDVVAVGILQHKQALQEMAVLRQAVAQETVVEEVVIS